MPLPSIYASIGKLIGAAFKFISDGFSRRNASGLGVSDTGQIWTLLRGSSWSVTGNVGSPEGVAQAADSATTYPLASVDIFSTETTTSLDPVDADGVARTGCGPAFWITDANSWWASTVFANTSLVPCNCTCNTCSGGTYPNCSCGSTSSTTYSCKSCSGGTYPSCSCGSYGVPTTICNSCPNLDCGYLTCASCAYCGSTTETCTWYCSGNDGEVVVDSCGISRTCGKSPGYRSATRTVCNSCPNYDCGLATCPSCANCGSTITINYYCNNCPGGTYPNCSCGSTSSTTFSCNNCSGGTYPTCSCGSSCDSCSQNNYYLRILSSVGGAVSTATGDVAISSAAKSIVVQTSGNTITSKAYSGSKGTGTLLGTNTVTPSSPTKGTKVGMVKAPSDYDQGSTMDNFSSTI